MTELERIKQETELKKRWINEYQNLVHAIDYTSEETYISYFQWGDKIERVPLSPEVKKIVNQVLQQELIRFENEGFEEWVKKEGYEL